MPSQGHRKSANPTRATERDSAFGPLRRLYYRNERRLIAGWLVLLLGLNGLPFAWLALDEHYELEAKIIEKQELHFAKPLRAAARLARKGTREEAIAEYRRLLSGMPRLQIPERGGRERLEATTILSSLELEAGRPKRAQRLAAEVVKSDPLDYRAHTAYANALAELGKTDRAVAHYERSLAMHPVQLDVVKQLMSLDLEKTRYDDVISRVDHYLNATFVSKGAIYFSEAYDQLDKSRDVLHFPVILDGAPHTYRVFTNSNRNDGATRFSSLPTIEGLRVVPALVDHVVAKIDSLEIHQRRGADTRGPIEFRAASLDKWRRLGHLDVFGNGLTYSPRSLSSLAGEVSIDAPKSVTFIEIRMALQRPVDTEFLDMMQVAYRNTLQHEQGQQIAKRLHAYDELARSAGPDIDREVAVLHAKGQP